MNGADLVVEGYGRISGIVRRVLYAAGEGDAAALTYRIDPRANTIAWLVWHLSRIQDDHVADAAGLEQVWHAGGWHERSGLPFERGATGYGHDSDDVAAVRLDADFLLGYHEAVQQQSADYVRELTDQDLDRVVDTAWDPPVTLGVRLVSVLGDGLQHAGQAAYILGVAERRTA